MVCHQHQGGIDASNQALGRRRAQFGGQALRHRSGAIRTVGQHQRHACCRRGWKHVHHRCHHPSSRAGHGIGAQVGAQWVMGTGHHHRPAHHVRCSHVGSVTQGERFPPPSRSFSRPGRWTFPGPRRPVIRVGIPQSLGHLFERHGGGQFDSSHPPVGRAVVAELGDGGGHRGQSGLDSLCGAGPKGQPLDVVHVEEAPAAVRRRVGREQPPAHVGVERGDLDPETTGCLITFEHPSHGFTLGSNIDLINVYTRTVPVHTGQE